MFIYWFMFLLRRVWYLVSCLTGSPVWWSVSLAVFFWVQHLNLSEEGTNLHSLFFSFSVINYTWKVSECRHQPDQIRLLIAEKRTNTSQESKREIERRNDREVVLKESSGIGWTWLPLCLLQNEFCFVIFLWCLMSFADATFGTFYKWWIAY